MKNSRLTITTLFFFISAFCAPIANLPAESEKYNPFSILKEIYVQKDTIRINTDKPAAFNIFKVSSPPRLVVDLTNTENDWKIRDLPLKRNSLFSRVRSGQFQDQPVKIARVVIELKSPIVFETATEGNTIVLKAQTSKNEKIMQVTKTYSSPESMPAVPTPQSAVNSPAVSDQHSSPEKSQSLVEAYPTTSASKDPTSNTPAYPDPVKQAKSAAEPTSLFGRAPVELDFEGISLKDLFQTLSEKSGVNIVFSDQVVGKISLHLKDVPFKEAMDTILSIQNLRCIALGKNIVQVMTQKEHDSYKVSAVSVTKVFPINYARAIDVDKQLGSIRQTLVSKGQSQVDDRTNSIILTDTPGGIEDAARLLADLDKPAPEVMIEAKIVQVTLGNSLDLGITWGAAYTDQSGGKQVTIGAVNPAPNLSALPGSGGPAGSVPSFGLNGGLSPLNPTQGANLENQGTGFSAAQGLGFTFGFVKDVVRLNAALTALQQKNKSKILSDPKIATLNNQTASIASSIDVPYITNNTQTTAAGGVTNLQVVNHSQSGISLNVTPTINADGRIRMDIVPNITNSQPTNIGVPQTTSQNAKTTVIIKDGETFVIGGLITESESEQKAQIPILGSIPLIGHFFKKTSVAKTRGELLVFVTPKIIPY